MASVAPDWFLCLPIPCRCAAADAGSDSCVESGRAAADGLVVARVSWGLQLPCQVFPCLFSFF